MSNTHYVLAQLRGYLAELDRLTPLAKAGSPDAIADHDAWMQKHDHICRVAQWAEWSALTTVPDEVALMLQAIETRKTALLNMFPMLEK